jgi:hypothetical protein
VAGKATGGMPTSRSRSAKRSGSMPATLLRISALPCRLRSRAGLRVPQRSLKPVSCSSPDKDEITVRLDHGRAVGQASLVRALIRNR